MVDSTVTTGCLPDAGERAARRFAEECHTISGSTQYALIRHGLAPGVIAFVLVLVGDQISKAIVLNTLGPGGARDEITVVPGFLRLIFVRNTGSAFGMFQGQSELLGILAVAATLLLGAYFFRSATRDHWLSLALGLQLGGAVGNIIDRYRHGYVVDWIDVPRWPTFNIADSGVTVGVILLMWTLLFRNIGDRSSDDRSRAATPVAGEDG